jgi:Co/Zn/Cd efflux system component
MAFSRRGRSAVQPMHLSLRGVVVAVVILNMGYFGIEFTVALAIGSVSLFADSIDFLEDASLNLLIAFALGWSGAVAAFRRPC